MGEQKEIEDMKQTQHPPWLVKTNHSALKEKQTQGNDSEKKQHFLKHKEKHSSSKEGYTDGSKSTRRKVGYAAVFTDSTRRGVLPEEASIHTAEMTSMKEIKEREDTR